jgi:hypothetical protein
MLSKIVTLAALMGGAVAQQVGTQTTETHPKMTWQKCSSGGSCSTVNGEVTIDANWRWVHDKNGYTNWYVKFAFFLPLYGCRMLPRRPLYSRTAPATPDAPFWEINS